MHDQEWKALVLDLGDVVFDWQSELLANIRATLKDVLRTEAYAQYELGQILEEATFDEKAGKELGMEGSAVRSMFEASNKALKANDRLIDFVRKLKSETEVQVYVMSNVPKPDADYLHSKYPEIFSVFDQVFTSGRAGVRKPDSRFFAKVVQEGHLIPERTVFIDDKIENVDAAQAVGMLGIQFVDTDDTVSKLRNLFFSGYKQLQ